MRLDDPRLADLAAATDGLSAVISFVEESADHRLFIAAGLFEDGELRHVHRKLFLPTYGLFDERRFFAQGDALRAVPSRLGVGHRDRHLRGLLASDGAPAARARRRPDPGQRLLVAGPRPGRDQRGRSRDGDVVAHPDANLCPADDVVRRLLQPGRGRRVDLVLGRLRGHRAVRPGAVQRPALRRGPVHGRDVALQDIRRERIALPLLRDERPELEVRELGRIIAERAGLATDSTAEPDAEPGFDLAPLPRPVRVPDRAEGGP